MDEDRRIILYKSDNAAHSDQHADGERRIILYKSENASHADEHAADPHERRIILYSQEGGESTVALTGQSLGGDWLV
jgi:hypothetical protein